MRGILFLFKARFLHNPNIKDREEIPPPITAIFFIFNK